MKKTSRQKSSVLTKILRTKGMANYMSHVVNDMLALKGQRISLDWFVRISAVIFGHRTNALIRANMFLVREFRSLAKSNGLGFLVKYLKACNVLVMQGLAGMKIKATQDLGLAVSRTRRGLPRILPSI